MRKYKTVEVSEAVLEDLMRQSPELIEPELKYVDHQAFTTRGPLDVLLVDSGHSLVVAELKVVEDDGMLLQGLDYYDYVLRNLEGFVRAYQHHKIDPEQEPRLFLIAPSFSVTLLNRIKWIRIPISLFTFQCLKFDEEKDEIVPIYKEVSPPQILPVIEAYSLDDRFNYITDSKMRSIAHKLVDEIKLLDSTGILIEPTKYDISIKITGRVFAYLAPRRKHFMIYTNDAEGKWTGYPVNNEKDIEPVMTLARTNFEKAGGKLK